VPRGGTTLAKSRPVPRGRPYSIAFFLTSFEVGGTERQMVELIRRLDPREFSVHVACFHRRGPLLEAAAEHAHSVEAFPVTGFGRPQAWRQMLNFARWCRRIEARIVHTCELYSNVFGLPAAALAGVPVRVGNRRELATPDKSRGQLLAQRAAYAGAHAVVGNSNAASAQLRREGVPARKIHTIPNGVDLDAFSHRRESAPRESPAGGRARIITVANLRPEKGHDTLLAAAARVLEVRPDAEWSIVGDGPLRPALEREAAARGLAGRVHFLGERRDVAALLAASDLFVLPSRWEASPNALIEAMAAGLPVVATRVGGIPELVDDGTTGVLVGVDDAAAMSGEILALLQRPDRAAALGRAAGASVARFSFDRMVARFAHLYRSELYRRALAPEPGPELATY
jgi:L-malate glycosyltransferase